MFTLGVEIDYQSESKTKQNNKLISIIQYHPSKMVGNSWPGVTVGLFEQEDAFKYSRPPGIAKQSPKPYSPLVMLKNVRGNSFSYARHVAGRTHRRVDNLRVLTSFNPQEA